MSGQSENRNEKEVEGGWFGEGHAGMEITLAVQLRYRTECG